MQKEREDVAHRTAVVSFKTLDQAIAAFDEISDTVRVCNCCRSCRCET
jgi:hypothetical protein